MKEGKTHIIITIFILLFHITVNAQIVINEVQYKNVSTRYDSEGNTPDWIELYNNTDTLINLENYQLSDDEELTDYWTFPKIKFQPHSFLVIYASGKDTTFADEIHTDFKLSVMDDPLILINNKGEVLDHIEVQCIPPDKSFGCFPDGSNSKAIQNPSPGISNDNSDTLQIHFKPDSIILSHPSGLYKNSIQIEIKNQNLENIIVYTLDGDDPDFDSPVYSDLISLSDISSNKNRFANKGNVTYKTGNLIAKANIVRARVYSEGCPASKEISNTYFINSNKAFDYQTPIVSIITDKDNLFDDDIGIYTAGNHQNYGQHGKEWERQVHLEIFDSNTQVIDQNAGVRIHGRGSRIEDQKSLRIYARKKYGQESFSYQFFEQKPFNSFKTLIISAEKTYTPLSFKDEICTSIISEIGLDYQAWQMVIVFINGEYWGIHHIREYQKEEYFFNNYSYKNDSFDLITHNRGEGPVADLGNDDAYHSLISFIELNDIRLEENYSYVASKLDIDNMIDYYIAQIYFANFDFPDNNYRMWCSQNNESKWRWLFYDCEACMHFVQMNNLKKYIQPNVQANFEEIWDVFLLNKLLVNETFKAKFYTAFRYHLENTFNTGRVLGQISAFKDEYEPYIIEHIYRWNKPISIRKWEENIHTLEQFALQRPLILEEQLNEIFINPFITYPNPTDNIVNIKLFSNHSDVKVKLYSINGSLVYENDFYNINLISFHPNIKSGMYLLQVYIENRIYTDKILFQ